MEVERAHNRDVRTDDFTSQLQQCAGHVEFVLVTQCSVQGE